MRSPIAIALFWIGTYLLITLLPLLILLIYPPPAARGFWVEFSVALGFIGLAMMALQFVLTARVRRIEASYGLDILLQFHRLTSLAAFGMVLLHPIVLFAVEPETRQLLNFWEAPWRARLAILGTLAFVAMVITTIWRKPLHIPYEPWRTSHSVLSILAMGLGLGHALGVSYYLSLLWKEIIWTGMALIVLWLIAYVRLIKPWMMIRKPYLVESVTPQRGNVWTLTLHPWGHDGFCFQPGQFSWLTLDTVPLSMRQHPFSMSSNAEQAGRVEFSIKALGDFTSTIKDVEPGTKAYVDGPYGVFTVDLYQDSAGFVLVAGGVGITPMMSILSTAAERKDSRPYLLIYASKTWDDITFRDALEALKTQLNLEIVYVLREPPKNWLGEVGYVDKDLLARHIPKQKATRHYFICASPVMMEQAERALHDLDVPVTQVHMEHFNLA